MPGISWVELVPHVARQLQLADSGAAVLDLGAGRGFYGATARQFRDQDGDGKDTYLVGVEVWQKYKNPLWELYDELHVTTIEAFLIKDDRRYQVITLLDVIEHLPQNAGRLLLKDLARRLVPDGQLLVSSPSTWFNQGPLAGNPYEVHRSLWSIPDLR